MFGQVEQPLRVNRIPEAQPLLEGLYGPDPIVAIPFHEGGDRCFRPNPPGVQELEERPSHHGLGPLTVRAPVGATLKPSPCDVVGRFHMLWASDTEDRYTRDPERPLGPSKFILTRLLGQLTRHRGHEMIQLIACVFSSQKVPGEHQSSFGESLATARCGEP